MNIWIFTIIIVLVIILGIIVYRITEKNKGLTVLSEMIIVTISILTLWLKSDDYKKNVEQDIAITTINKDSKQIEEHETKETSRETTTTIDTTNTTTTGTTTTTDTLLDTITTTNVNETETEKTTPKETSVPPINNPITISSNETTKNVIMPETTTTLNIKWNEIEINETLYIKKSCYSRTRAVVGSDSVKKYSAGTKINVVAATDTSYYKLADGTYIHSDYITDQIPYDVTTITSNEDIEKQPYEQIDDDNQFWMDVFGY